MGSGTDALVFKTFAHGGRTKETEGIQIAAKC